MVSPHGGRVRAIAMWDFSWLERRWPGAGYEDWERALDELVERGYNAVRIDPYPRRDQRGHVALLVGNSTGMLNKDHPVSHITARAALPRRVGMEGAAVLGR